MATLTPSPQMQFFDNNGIPLSGGKLYTYAAGTTTPLATYTDSTGGTPNTNPIILDSRGEASVWLGDSLYYMELKTSTDTLIWSADNIGGIATANSVSRMAVTLTNIAALRATAVSTTYEAITKGYYTAGDGGHGEYYGVTGAAAGTYVDNGGTIIVPTGGNGSSAWKLKYFDKIGISQFGAVGSGDETARIQAGLTAYKSLVLDNLAYTASTTLTTQTGQNINGFAPDRVGTVFGSKITSSATIGVTIPAATDGNKLNGIRILPSSTRPVGSFGIKCSAHVYLDLSDISMDGWETGIYQNKSQSSVYKNLRILNSKDGIVFFANEADGFNNLAIFDTVISAQSLRHNLDWDGTGLEARNCDFSGAVTTAGDTGILANVRIRKSATNVFGTNASFYGCYTEALAPNAFAYHCTGGVTHIHDQFVSGNATGTRAGGIVRADSGAIVYVHDVYGYDFFTNLFVADGAGTIIYLMPSCRQGSITVTTEIVETNGGKVIDLRSGGQWVDVAYAAGNFTSTGTWTVDAGDQVAFSYVLNGKTMTVTWYLQNTSTSGAASATLNIAIPGGYTARKRVTGTIVYSDNGVLGNGWCDVLASGSVIRLVKDLSATNWNNASANATTVAGQLTFEIN